MKMYIKPLEISEILNKVWNKMFTKSFYVKILNKGWNKMYMKPLCISEIVNKGWNIRYIKPLYISKKIYFLSLKFFILVKLQIKVFITCSGWRTRSATATWCASLPSSSSCRASWDSSPTTRTSICTRWTFQHFIQKKISNVEFSLKVENLKYKSQW